MVCIMTGTHELAPALTYKSHWLAQQTLDGSHVAESLIDMGAGASHEVAEHLANFVSLHSVYR